ncbi:MAG: MerR family transcriptional regulator [Methylococcales bacterium]|nr:MerR family transcriptional regulator [Methylococcales bacterium]
MFSISLVSRETGISIATLRKWETRYGFPKPVRHNGYTRSYSKEDIAYLHEVKRLIDLGMRPSKLFSVTPSEFSALALTHPTRAVTLEQKFIEDVIELLISHEIKKLRKILDKKLKKLGVLDFVEKVAQPLTVLVGQKWADGVISIFTEHCYSEQMSQVLNSVEPANLKYDETLPRILLTTLSGERHTLGLDMVKALLSEQKAHCINLGAEVPLLEIPQAALHYKVNVVGLSFSASFPKRAMTESLKQLRLSLAPEIGLWIGGSGAKQLAKLPNGIEISHSTAEVLAVFESYKKTHAVIDSF